MSMRARCNLRVLWGVPLQRATISGMGGHPHVLTPSRSTVVASTTLTEFNRTSLIDVIPLASTTETRQPSGSPCAACVTTLAGADRLMDAIRQNNLVCLNADLDVSRGPEAH